MNTTPITFLGHWVQLSSTLNIQLVPDGMHCCFVSWSDEFYTRNKNEEYLLTDEGTEIQII